MPTKLHELLAVEGSLETQAMKVTADLRNTFEKKRHLFEEKRVVFTPSEEGKVEEVEAQSNIQTTVAVELRAVGKFIAQSLDASYGVADANTKARASVILEDVAGPFLTNLPATALLELEKTVAGIKDLLAATPTLDPAKGFEPDSARVPLYRAREVKKVRTRKSVEVVVKYQATKEHPAQTEMIPLDKPIGTIREQEWSGMITPTEKSDMLNRCEVLIRAIRKARSIANSVEVPDSAKIGATIVGYLLGGLSGGTT